MEAYKAFDRAIQIIQQAEMAGTFKQSLLSELNYFRSQSLCESDRQLPKQVLQARWNKVLADTERLKVFDLIRKEENVWIKLEYYFGNRRLPVVEQSLAPDSSRYENWDAVDFLQHLEREAMKPKVSDHEWKLMRVGILYLHSQSKLPRGKRSEEHMKMVYGWIHPYLERSGMLVPFKKESILIDKFKQFLGQRSW